MKHVGSKLEFTEERMAEMSLIYRRCLSQARIINRGEILRKVAETATSRFYVSEERAAAVVGRMLAGRPLGPMNENKKKMFDEILSRSMKLRKARPERSLIDIVSEVVNQPAPRFYLTPETIGVMLSRHRRRKG